MVLMKPPGLLDWVAGGSEWIQRAASVCRVCLCHVSYAVAVA